jgi:hypothetical protein
MREKTNLKNILYSGILALAGLANSCSLNNTLYFEYYKGRPKEIIETTNANGLREIIIHGSENGVANPNKIREVKVGGKKRIGVSRGYFNNDRFEDVRITYF